MSENTEWKEEWKGMPEFIQEKQREHAKIIVRFRNEEDLQDFARRLGQTFTARTKSAWHPPLPVNTTTRKKYVNEP